MKLLTLLQVGLVVLYGCQSVTRPQIEYIQVLPGDIALCGSLDRINSEDLVRLNQGEIKVPFDPSMHPRLIGQVSDLPLINPNDNRTPAGKMVDGVLELDLEVVLGDLRCENNRRPGLRVAAIAEKGKPATVPGPLVRIDTGTRIRALITNSLKDSTITVFGFQKRPSTTPDSLFIQPGASKSIEFDAGEPGSYFYAIRLGAGINNRMFGEEDQLTGAFIIDPKGGSPPDRVFVMNIFSSKIDTALHPWGSIEALTINGKSWPYTERQRPNVGDTLRWRIINANSRNHPMHLHGFYYDVTSSGTMLKDTKYAQEEYRTIVTEFMLSRTTMNIQWVATRPGNWLFHCHLSFHVSPDMRLPGISDFEKEYSHMAGLVLGIQIPPGPTDLISKGDPKYLTLQSSESDGDSINKYQFTLISNEQNESLSSPRPGPLIVLKQYQDTYITLENNMSKGTGIHWHGLEVNSWSDGVPDWSSSEGLTSPVVGPGEKFTYKLSLMRAGSFIYHSHLNDVDQLMGGLYGPLIVLGEYETYDPELDHFYIIGWTNKGVDLNGHVEQPVQHACMGETHRIRVMHIAPAGNITARMRKDDQAIPLKFIAKDGADISWNQQKEVDVSPRFGVGETADFAFTPTEPGTYEFLVGYPRKKWVQKWEVRSD